MLTVIRSAVVSSSMRHHARAADMAVHSMSTWSHLRDHYRHSSSSTVSSGEKGGTAADRTNEHTAEEAVAATETTNPHYSSQTTDLKRTGKSRPAIDRSKVPVLNEKDLDEMFVSGHGPGGQKVNKAVNACQIRHRPTGIVVKIHQSRSLEKNREIAREILIQRLDNLYNGEQSVDSQKKRIALQKISTRDNLSEKRRFLKEQYKKKLGETKPSNETDYDVTSS